MNADRSGLRVAHDPDGPSWMLFWHGLRLDIHLHPTALVCDHFAPEGMAPPGKLWSSWREHELLLNARLPGMLEVGPRPGCLAWRLEGWGRPDPWSLSIMLRAEGAALVCEQRFSVDAATGLLLRGTVLRHAGVGDPVSITAASSLWLTLRGGARAVHTLSGEWGGEAQAAVHPGGHAGLLLDSRSGKTGFEFQPWIVLEGEAGVHLCSLLWSGNWALQARLRAGTTTISGGLNEWGLAHALQPGEALELPGALIGFVAGTVGDAVRRLHDWRRARRPDPDRAVPVQFNTWYALDEDVDEARVLGLIPQAADLGCEVFVLDAGWYATHAWSPLSNWHARAGDWIVDPLRFPRGLAPVAEACRAAGMGFGLWCEPEAVGSCAAIRRSHPEWLHHLDGRAPGEDARAILNLGVPAAWEHAFAVLAGLIRATGAAWLKWDFNADLAAGGWAPGLPAGLVAGDPLVAHVRGLYRLQDAIRAAFPDLVLEMCASGGGRMDGAILMRAHTNWISDNPQAVAKLSIHMGMQRAHPAVSCNDWLVDWPARGYSGIAGVDRRGDLVFRLRVAMLGSFGISAPIGGWSEAERAEVRAHVRLYRDRVRALVHHGDQYQLTPPPTLEGGGGWAAVWYRAKNGGSGVLFAFRLEGEAERDFVLPGLREDAVAEGAARIAGGVRVALAAPFSSALVFLD